MKALFILPAFILIVFATVAQKPNVTWGEEFKMRKGTTDLEVVHTDHDGVYLQEGHLALKSYFVIGATTRASATLVKLDRSMAEIYRNDFNRELKGKNFIQFYILQDRLYIFASEWIAREKTLSIYGAEIDKKTGEMAGGWVPVTSFQKEEKRDEINYRLSYNADSSRMVVVSTIEGRDRNEYTIQEFDKALKATTKPVKVTNEFDPKTFRLEDVLYLDNKKIILVGRVFEYQEGKKKKNKFLDFSHYNIRLYSERGRKEKEFNTSINGRWLISTKLVQEKGKDIVLAAFYSKTKKGKTIDGLLVQRINSMTGDPISTSEKHIDHSLLTGLVEQGDYDDDDDDKESRAERKERQRLDNIKDEGEAFSRYMRFRNIFHTPDNGLVVLAEEYHQFTYTRQSSSMGSDGRMGTTTTTTYTVYECGDLFICKINANTEIGWLQVVPKSQREVIQTGQSRGNAWVNYFEYNDNRPFYAGFGAIQTGNTVRVLFNDHPKNATVNQPGQKVKLARRFNKSDCFVLTVNLSNGHIDRKMLYTNTGIPTSMPRLGSVFANDMYMVGKEDRLFGKSKIAVGRVTMN